MRFCANIFIAQKLICICNQVEMTFIYFDCIKKQVFKTNIVLCQHSTLSLSIIKMFWQMSTEKVSVVISSLSYHLAYFLPKPDQNHSLISPLFFARLINVTFRLFLFFLSFLTFSFSFPEAFRLIRLYLPLLHMLMIFVNKVACIPLKGENRATRRKTFFSASHAGSRKRRRSREYN